MWEYVKGSERDFEGVPDCALFILGNKYLRYWAKDADSKIEGYIVDSVEIIAERRKVDDLRSRTNDASLQQAFDTVQRPAHYNQSGIECIDAIAASMSAEEFRGFLKGNVQKYVWRSEHKGGAEDYRKAQYYLDRLVKELSK